MKLGLLLCGALVCTAVGNNALACGFIGYGDEPRPKKIIPKRPPPMAPGDRVAQADREMEQGTFSVAIADVKLVYPNLEQIEWVSSMGDPLQTRAARVMALAIVRSSDARLPWATKILEDIAKHHANDPTAQVELAEALAKSPDTRARAKQILEPLVAKDLVGNAHAIAALASIRENEGTSAADLRARCTTMTKTPEICKAPAIAVSKIGTANKT